MTVTTVATMNLQKAVKEYASLTANVIKYGSEGDTSGPNPLKNPKEFKAYMRSLSGLRQVLTDCMVVIDDPSIVITMLALDPDIKNMVIVGNAAYIAELYVGCCDRGVSEDVDKYLSQFELLLTPAHLKILGLGGKQ